MHHIDEHTIELYVLNSDLVAERREEIKTHLVECYGCRMLAEQIEAFYRRADDGLGKNTQPDKEMSTSLVRSRQQIEPYFEPYYPPIPYKPNTFVGRFTHLIRRHPVIAGASSFATMAAVAAALLFGVKDFGKDTNPAFVHINPDQGKLEVYNRGSEMLWSLPSEALLNVDRSRTDAAYKRIALCDLDGDGKNELITTLLSDENNGSLFPLSIYSYDHKLLHRKYFQVHAQFRGTTYGDDLGADNLCCIRSTDGAKPEIYVGATTGRSPNFVIRTDGQLNELGYYVHYGRLDVSFIDSLEGKERLFLFGQNDLGEIDSLTYAVVAVLDPEKIIGKTESSGSTGFGVPTSTAELYYIRFPLSDMNYLLNSAAAANLIRTSLSDGKKTYGVSVRGFYRDSMLAGDVHPQFDYIFSDRMEILQVKFNSTTLRLRQRLVAQGRLRGTFDETYLDNLKNGVRYWDGKEWRKEVCRVQPSTGLP